MHSPRPVLADDAGPTASVNGASVLGDEHRHDQTENLHPIQIVDDIVPTECGIGMYPDDVYCLCSVPAREDRGEPADLLFLRQIGCPHSIGHPTPQEMRRSCLP